jgi:plastocyanin
VAALDLQRPPIIDIHVDNDLFNSEDKMRKPIFSGLLVLGLILVTGIAVVFAGGTKTVYTRGDEVLIPNVQIRADLRFSPGPAVVNSGDTIQWEHADHTEAPHTVTIVQEDALVQDFGDFLGECPQCDAAAGAALAGHGLLGGPLNPVLDDGDGEFNNAGDSLLFFHGQTVSAQINAAPGTKLLYFCALHPWMQGEIIVE